MGSIVQWESRRMWNSTRSFTECSCKKVDGDDSNDEPPPSQYPARPSLLQSHLSQIPWAPPTPSVDCWASHSPALKARGATMTVRTFRFIYPSMMSIYLHCYSTSTFFLVNVLVTRRSFNHYSLCWRFFLYINT